MPAISASAPGKVILFGEHAVVYGQPAIAVPINQVSAKAIITPLINQPSGTIHIDAPEINLNAAVTELRPDDPLATALNHTLQAMGIEQPPAFKLRVTSTIPLAAGLGSGAAVSVAIIRAVSGFLGQFLGDDQVSALAYEVEKLYHGTPSGIDNTVVAYAKPVYFIKGQPLETFTIDQPFTIVIADTGFSTPTRVTVGHVRSAWQADPTAYDVIFNAIGDIARQARAVIEGGQSAELGPLMDANHVELRKMGVSSPELDKLVQVARQAGALGAKLSGGGRGGNMIALVEADQAEAIAQTLQNAGATHTIVTKVL